MRSNISGDRRRGSFLVLAVSSLALLGLAVTFLPSALEDEVGPAEARRHGPCPNAHANPKNLDSDEARQSVQCLINKKRRSRGKGSLAVDGKLAAAAQRHSVYMVEHGCFAHQCRGEKGMAARIKRTGYLGGGGSSWGVGENIAAGTGWRGSPSNMVKAWMHSPPHRANILAPDFEHVGVGMAHGTPAHPNGDGATYTVDFGFKRG